MKTAPPAPQYDPLDLMYAAVGYLGLLYESQLVYLKQELEKGEPLDGNSHVVAVLQSVHSLTVEFATSVFSQEPIDYDALRGCIAVDERTLKELAADGRRLVGLSESGSAER